MSKKPAFARAKGGKRGGKLGHKGASLALSSTPDKQIDLLPDQCSCGHVLDQSKALEIACRQAFDWPVPKLEVVQYRQWACRCEACGKKIVGAFPDPVVARVQHGAGARLLETMLNSGYAMPVKKIQQLFSDLFGYKINEPTIISILQTGHDRLAADEQKIKEMLLEAKACHSDETGVRAAGKQEQNVLDQLKNIFENKPSFLFQGG